MPVYMSHSNSSRFSDVSRPAPMHQANGSMFNENDLGHGGAPTVNGASLDVSRDYEFEVSMSTEGDQFAMDGDYSMAQQPYPSPIEEDMSFAVPNDGTACTPEDDPNAMNLGHGWTTSVDNQEFRTGLMNDSYQAGWTEVDMAPSASSSQSSQHPDTPLSMAQDFWIDDSLGMQPPLVPGQDMLLPPPEPYYDGQRFEGSSVLSSFLSDIPAVP